MPRTIVDVTSDPPLAFIAGGAGGASLHAMQYSGVCAVANRSAKLFERREPARLGFYVPEAGPFRPSHLLAAWAEVVPTRMNVETGRSMTSGPYGVDGVSVELVDDTRGSGMMWPYLWMVVWGGGPLSLRYRMTVTQPLENA